VRGELQKSVCVRAHIHVYVHAYMDLFLPCSPRSPFRSHGERDVIDRTFHRASRAVRIPSRAIAREFLECSSVSAETMLSGTIRSHE